MDLVTANYTSDSVSILRNLGDGTFVAEVTYAHFKPAGRGNISAQKTRAGRFTSPPSAAYNGSGSARGSAVGQKAVRRALAVGGEEARCVADPFDRLPGGLLLPGAARPARAANTVDESRMGKGRRPVPG